MRKCPRPRSEGPDPIPESSGGKRPVHEPVGFCDFTGIGGRLIGLRSGLKFLLNGILNGLDEQIGSQTGEAIMQRGRIVRFPDGGAELGENIPSIQSLIHLHDGDSRFLVTVEDSPLDRSGSAVFREERGVDIKATQAGRLKNGGRENLSIGSHHDQVGILRLKTSDKLWIARFFRLINGEIQFQSSGFDRGRLELETPSARSIRLRDHRKKVQAGSLRELGEAGASQLGGSHEDDVQIDPSHFKHE